MSEKSGNVEALLQDVDQFAPSKEFLAATGVPDPDEHYRRSLADLESYWAEIARGFEWQAPWQRVLEWNDSRAKWFVGARCNITESCLDRHVRGERKNKAALVWLGEDGEERIFTFGLLHRSVCKLASALRGLGIGKGDRVAIYMPLTPEGIIAMLACARIGAVHSVIYAGLGSGAIRDRVLDAGAKLVIGTDIGYRRGKTVELKSILDEALADVPSVERVVLHRRANPKRELGPREIDFDTLLESGDPDAPAESMDSEDWLFILYTSGSTGKPKGVLHTTGGYQVFVAVTHRYVFDYHEGDIFWCTADVGWVTGHSYILYGPLANGATTLMFEGVPNYPSMSRFWEVIDKHKVNTFYTAPTAIRALMQAGDGPVKRTSRASLRLLGTVGEPINPEAWTWYHRVVGDGRCPIVDTWWQTETGGHLITPLPGATRLKPGSATLPFFGVAPVIVDADGKVLEGECSGNLCVAASWPGQLSGKKREIAKVRSKVSDSHAWTNEVVENLRKRKIVIPVHQEPGRRGGDVADTDDDVETIQDAGKCSVVAEVGCLQFQARNSCGKRKAVFQRFVERNIERRGSSRKACRGFLRNDEPDGSCDKASESESQMRRRAIGRHVYVPVSGARPAIEADIDSMPSLTQQASQFLDIASAEEHRPAVVQCFSI